ncbi:MAG: anti-sigma factor [Terrimesophilobacter sp.]
MSLTPREQADVEAALGLAVAPVTPSPDLKASIMAKLATTPQLPAETETTAPVVPSAAEHKAQTRWFTRPLPILVAAAAAVMLFVGGTFLGMGINTQPAQDLQATSLATLTSASDLQRASSTLSDGATATLIWSLDQQRSALLVSDLPKLPDGKTYQLWYIDSAGPRSAGTFDASATSTTWRVLDGEMRGGDTVGVTVEPAGGSTAPTTEPIVAIASA